MSGSMTREDFDAYLVPCFAPAPFIPVRAAGSRVWCNLITNIKMSRPH